MNQKTKNIVGAITKIGVVIYLLVVAYSFMQSIFPNRNKTFNSKTKPDTVIVEIPVVLHGNIDPKNSIEINTIIDTFWKDGIVDTAAILADYYTHHIYKTNYSDTNIDICQVDTTYKNILHPGPLDYNLHYKKKEITITKYIKEIKQPRILIGAGLSASSSFGLGLQLAAGYANNHGLQFVAATNIAGRQPNFEFTLLKPIIYKKTIQ